MTETEKMWVERVREWEKSGLPAEQFVEGKPYMASTLQWRGRQVHRLEQREKAQQSRNDHPPKRSKPSRKGKRAGGFRPWTSKPPSIAMAEVVRRPAAKVEAAIVIEVGCTRIRVVSGFDAALLGAVIRALQGAA